MLIVITGKGNGGNCDIAYNLTINTKYMMGMACIYGPGTLGSICFKIPPEHEGDAGNNIFIRYKTPKRAEEVFKEIHKAIESGEELYHIPLK